jgi:glycosyltransferase involved in cell wall biosynthesis
MITPCFFPEAFGGGERQALIVAEALGRLGVRVTLATPVISRDRPRREEMGFGEIIRFPVRHYPNFGGLRIGSTLAWTGAFVRWFVARRDEFDLIYVIHGRLHALAGLAAAAATGKPLAVKLGVGGEFSDFAALRAKRWLYGDAVLAWLLRRTDAFIVNSAMIQQDLDRAGAPPERCARIPNGVVTPDRPEVEGAFRMRAGTRFIFTGRLVEDKRPSVLIQALRWAVDKGADGSLTLVGDGPQTHELRGLVRDLGLEGRVTFAGRIDEVYPHLLAHDAFVSASLNEGQSNALLEAMACGCIPVVAEASGVEELVVSGENGFVCGADAAAFAEAMVAIVRMAPAERERLGWAAHERVRAQAGIDAIAARCLDVFEQLAERRAA